MEELARIWGRNIKASRRALQLRQEDLAKLLDVEQSTVSRWEAGRQLPRDRHRAALARYLHRDVENLFPTMRQVA